MRGFGLISYKKFPERHVFFILNPDFQWADRDSTAGIWPQYSTEGSEDEDLRSSVEPWKPMVPHGELKRAYR